jgi:peptide/nickel transport system permease protein
MTAYLLRRVLLSVLTLWAISLLAFALLRMAPGDAVTAALAVAPGEGGLSQAQIDQRRRDLGLDRSALAQYLDWLGHAVRFDAGRSLSSGEPVVEIVRSRVAVTVELATLGLVLVAAAGFGGGLLAAAYPGRPVDNALRVLTLLGLSTPAFWLGLLLIVGVASWTGYFLAGRYEPFGDAPVANLEAMLPAAAVLALRPAALLLRIVRASTLEATGARFFLLARLKGVSRMKATAVHALRVSALPALTVLGAQAVFLLGGAVVVEQVFGLPGVGRALVDAVLSRDFPVVQALLLLFGAIALGMNLLLDALYVRLDPQIRVTA